MVSFENKTIIKPNDDNPNNHETSLKRRKPIATSKDFAAFTRRAKKTK